MTELLGRPLTFGDAEQISAIKKIERESEEEELRRKYGCIECDKSGVTTGECGQCDGTGEIEIDCDECDGKGYIPPTAWGEHENY